MYLNSNYNIQFHPINTRTLLSFTQILRSSLVAVPVSLILTLCVPHQVSKPLTIK